MFRERIRSQGVPIGDWIRGKPRIVKGGRDVVINESDNAHSRERTRRQPHGREAAPNASGISLRRLDTREIDWAQLDALDDRNVFQTREWLDFIHSTQGAEPIVAEVRELDQRVGFFTGLVMSRFGIRILGSPFQGWATGYLGFNLPRRISRRAAVAALVDFAFGPLGCMHLELRDRPLTAADVEGLGFIVQRRRTFELDLRLSEDEIWAGFKSTCRTAIRKAEKSGVTVEEAHDLAFADEYHAQLRDVFAKRSLPPPYGVEFVRELIRRVEPTGRLLLLRARNGAGECIATGIYPGHGAMAYFWGGASWRQDQTLRPNDLLMWSAIRHWRARGVAVFDFGGAGDYKRKFGPVEVIVPLFRRSRFAVVEQLRGAAKHAIGLRRRLVGRHLR
jgi:CelD/BcsL family acetyltransferase involved in cellulose biosynthesis